MIAARGLVALLLVAGLVAALGASAVSYATPHPTPADAEHQAKPAKEARQFGKGGVKIEARGNVSSSNISGIAPGDKVKVEAKLREGKKLVLVVPGKGRVVANITGVSIDVASGKVRVNATVLSSTLGGISKGDGLSLSFTLTQFTIGDTATGKAATASTFKMEFVNKP